MPVDDRFVVRRFQPGDEHSILELFARSFHDRRSVAQWQWKYQENPVDRERISVAFDAGNLVGHYAGYPVAFVDGSRLIEANQIGDTMTDPSIRHIGRGPTSVLGRTALHFYENFCEGRVAFNYGFNVANIQKFSLRFLRSDRVEPVGYRIRDLESVPLPRAGKMERWARGVSMRLVSDISDEWDAFFTRVAPHYGFLTRRDASWIRWRYLREPERRAHVVEMRKWGVLVGWLVYRLRDGRLVIGDLLIDPDHADTLEIALRHLADVTGVASLEAWCPPRPSWLDELMTLLRLELRPHPQDLSVMCVPFVEKDAVTSMRERLYYTMGDSDLF